MIKDVWSVNGIFSVVVKKKIWKQNAVMCMYMVESTQQLCMEHFLASCRYVAKHSSQQVLLTARNEGTHDTCYEVIYSWQYTDY